MENNTATMTETYTTLTTAAMRVLANTFAAEVADCIEKDERYVEFLMEVLPEILSQKVGKLACDDDIELAMMVMERITLTATTY